ncbi:MAG: GTPase Era [Ignavibacteria bacterium]|nr:GTPase Era [Ignavibacteria bacterium]
MTNNFRAGFVAIVGKPNVGKSTLMNCILQHKLSIVTPKPQTTRDKILGIYNRENCQILFLDTPGIIEPKYKLHSVMMQSAHSSLDDADVVLLMIDATDFDIHSPQRLEKVGDDISFQAIHKTTKPTFLIINKVDAVEKGKILEIISMISQQFAFKEYIPISALNMVGISDLLKTIEMYLPLHPPYYSEDELSDKNERFFVSEIIREKVFQLLKQEIPYSTAVNVVEFIERPGKPDKISAEIVVERQSQKGIVIGARGMMLKNIGTRARKDIEQFLGRKVFLELFVKVREDWRENDTFLREYGYK